MGWSPVVHRAVNWTWVPAVSPAPDDEEGLAVIAQLPGVGCWTICPLQARVFVLEENWRVWPLGQSGTDIVICSA